jgi:hypothetical protein
MMRRLTMIVGLVLLLAAPAQASAKPRYDVPRGFTRCPDAHAWNGFFKWASQHHSSCAKAATFMRAYAKRAGGPRMPRHVDGFTCRIHFYENDEGDTYASRHTCTRRDVTIRFYGMV